MSSLAIVEIAGRDSVAAAVAAVERYGFTTLLPTVAYTGTETGDRSQPHRTVEWLRGRLGGSVEVLEPLELSDPALWAAMNARFASVIQERFGVHSPCLACHLYLHLLRVPVSWFQDLAPVVAGERDTHSGRIKLSQTPLAIEAAVEVLGRAGVELLEPIRGVAASSDIEALVGPGWPEGEKQLGCVLSGNYVGLDGRVRFDEAGYERYVREFLVPVGRAVVDMWREARMGVDAATPPEQLPSHDYVSLVRGVLER